jgi:hypothetical protein
MRFLPPLPPGMASSWLIEHIPQGSWLLDPLGASPALALEAARAGYRVLVASNNPVLSFMLETLAKAPASADFQSAMAELAMAKRGEERLEVHIRNLYRTTCSICNEPVEAQAFLWKKGENQPFARLYTCPRCGESGEQPVTPADLDRLNAMGGDRYQRARALQRVLLNDEKYREDVEEALDHYLPRSLYVLFTLINKIEGLGLPPEKVRLLHALLISMFDAGNTLWPWPGTRSRPKQLLIPPQFRENNLWIALESAAAEWTSQPGPVPLTHWPQKPPESGGICIYQGRVKALMPLPQGLRPQAILSAFPRPNQAFWTLSALWAGWLWGAEAALPLRNVLDRRRYDWNWHSFAVHRALSALTPHLPAATPFFGLLPELAPGFLGAVLIAAKAAGFQLRGIALRAETSAGRMDQDLAQICWYPAIPETADSSGESTTDLAKTTADSVIETSIHQAIQMDLTTRFEPAPYITEYAAGMAAVAQMDVIPYTTKGIPGDLFTRLQTIVTRAFTHRALQKLPGSPVEDERSLWTLAQPTVSTPPINPSPTVQLSLSDRVEMEIVRFMQKRTSFHQDELDQALCAQFPGLSTPAPDFVRVCLESYAEPVASQPGRWQIRANETTAARKADLQEMFTLLESVGQKMGYASQRNSNCLIWQTQGKAIRWFCCLASSVISRYVFAPPVELSEVTAGNCILVLPGSRSRLLQYKRKRNPALSSAAENWRFLKFRQLRAISWRESLSLDDFERFLREDTLTDEPTQMELFQ